MLHPARPDARDVVVKYVAALKAQDEATLKQLAPPDPESEKREKFMKFLFDKYSDLKPTMTTILNQMKIEVGQTKVEEDKATVPVTISHPDQSTTASLDVLLNWDKDKKKWVLSPDNTQAMSKQMFQFFFPIAMKTPVGKQIFSDVMKGNLDMSEFAGPGGGMLGGGGQGGGGMFGGGQ
jgi:hypothetical protein